jgi:hypothetical protein
MLMSLTAATIVSAKNKTIHNLEIISARRHPCMPAMTAIAVGVKIKALFE